jgi:hypothetical protein
MQHVNVVDCPSLFYAAEVLAEREGVQRLTFDYQALKDHLSELRARERWPRASLDLALVSTDLHSESQGRFVTALERLGFTVDRIDYRDAFVSMPPGRLVRERDSNERSVTSVSSRIAYLAGLLARYEDADLLVVSHSFELYAPFLDLGRRLSAGRVGLAYFSSLIDYRYRLAGFLDQKPRGGRAGFLDLETELSKLVAGSTVSLNRRPMGGEVFGKF